MSSNKEASYDAVLAYFQANWDYDLAPVRFENTETINTDNTGVDGLSSDDKTTDFITFNFESFDTSIFGIGSGAGSITQSLLTIQIFIAKGTGSTKLLQILDALTDLFHRKQIGDLRTHEMVTGTLGELDNFAGHVTSVRMENYITNS